MSSTAIMVKVFTIMWVIAFNKQIKIERFAASKDANRNDVPDKQESRADFYQLFLNPVFKF